MTADAQGDTLVLGVGNPLMGDDGVGVLAVQLLLARPDLPPGVAAVDGGTAGLGLIPLIAGYRRLILVDAVLMGEPPGAVRRFEWREARVAGHERPLSLHQSDLADALALAEVLGSLPAEVIVFGVQPQHTDWDQPLSEAVARALPDLVDALIAEVRS